MSPNDDLARWGEPPASEQELKQAKELSDLLQTKQIAPTAPAPERELLEVDSWLQIMVATVLTYSGLAENVPGPADAGGPSRPLPTIPDLRLRIYRKTPGGGYTLVGSTHPVATALRDLQRLPDDPDRVSLRTGDKARIDVVCDADGYLTVFNVGPQGTLNLLWPENFARTTRQPARVPLQVANVMLTPPAGRERLYAVWSRTPLSWQHLSDLGKPGVATRDMQRVQSAVEQMKPEDWHAVLLVLEHAAE